MVTLKESRNGKVGEVTNQPANRESKSKKGSSWLIALLLAILAILTLNFGAACAWLVSCGVSAAVATIIMVTIIVVIATVMLIFIYENPDWLQDIANDTGSAIATLGSGLGKATEKLLGGASKGLSQFIPEIAPWVLGGLAIWLLCSKRD